MMGVYLCISLGPLLSPALRSKEVIHAITGACSGDCNICGCSPESRASHTCCCSKKKQQMALAQDHRHDHQEETLPDCCKKAPVKEDRVVLSCGCPCGDQKSLALATANSEELLPFYFSAYPSAPLTPHEFTDHTRSLDSRDAEPPDPPPRRA